MGTSSAPFFWHIASTDVATFTGLDDLLSTACPDDALLLLKLLSEAPKELAIDDPLLPMHLLEPCSGHEDSSKASL